jgi:2,5-diamino-6-(ribosylamino)-4(3H)-pyrimidinone 5'-phosphate reductase
MGRVRLIVHNIASLDGKLAGGPGSVLLWGDPKFCAIAGAGTTYERLMDAYRPDAILEGSGSFVHRGAGPARLPELEGSVLPDVDLYRDYLPESVVDRPGHRGWFVVVDSRGRVAWTYKEFPSPEWRGWHLLVLVASSTPARYLEFLRREEIPYLVAGAEHVSLATAIERLASELGVERIVATGGSRFNGALLREGLVDEVDLVLVPALVGGEETPSLFGGPPLGEDDWPLRLKRTQCEMTPDGHLRLHYQADGYAKPPLTATDAGAGAAAEVPEMEPIG